MRWICFILSILNLLSVRAQDTIPEKEKWLIRGYIKNLETFTFDQRFQELTSSNLIHSRLNVKWRPNTHYTIAAELRNRLFWGEEIKLIPQFSSLLRNRDEYLNLQMLWFDKKGIVLHTNLERLNVDCNTKNWNLRVGRQRINWGRSTIWNPNDIFNSYNFLDFDYEERPGTDATRLKYTLNSSSNIEFAFGVNRSKQGNVQAIKYAFNYADYDIHLITGLFEKDPTLGIGWAGPLGNAGLKGEVQYFLRGKDSVNRINATVEADYIFKSGWYINASVLYVRQGLNHPVDNWNQIDLKLSPKNLMPTQWNFIFTVLNDVTPLLNVNMSMLFAPGTDLLILYPSFNYNIATNLDINLVWQSFFATIRNQFQATNHQAFLRLKWSF